MSLHTSDSFNDCYYSFSNGILVIGNSRFEHKVVFEQNVPRADYMLDKALRYRWENIRTKSALCNLPFIDWQSVAIESSSLVRNNNDLSERSLLIDLALTAPDLSAHMTWQIYPAMPFFTARMFVKKMKASETAAASGVNHGNIEKLEQAAKWQIPESGTIYTLPIDERHLKLDAIRLHDITDHNDMLVKTTTEQLYTARRQRFSGNIFLMHRYLHGNTLMIVKEGPTPDASLSRNAEELSIQGNTAVSLIGTGLGTEAYEGEALPCYGITVGVGTCGGMLREYKRFYRATHSDTENTTLTVMSNTWGDRNQDKAVNESFMTQEIFAAKLIGVDVVEIDDGWQQGVTSNSALKKGGVWEGYYAADPGFWNVNAVKFPHGLDPLVTQAVGSGLSVGLWFSPDSSNDFANHEKDAAVLHGFYQKYGIRHFKLDGIKIRNKTCEANLIKLMTHVIRDSNARVAFTLDVTAEVRFGYIYEKQFGTLFVENRYTDWGNYYPHRTLKNVWLLSGVLPARKLQFEVLNNKRNREKYGDDPLAPAMYGIDYLFASVMVSHPLLWMELQHLTPDDASTLANIIAVFKQHRDALHAAEVFPIGEIPDGTSFTGFQAVTGADEGYLILIKEYSSRQSYRYKLTDAAGRTLTVTELATNASGGYTVAAAVDAEGYIDVSISSPRSYVFLKYCIEN
ncbi:MAG: alpha-galactosidase [Spirochaetes bacterium]|nr:alpha-galactosidase [Spirochaetota bacterium]